MAIPKGNAIALQALRPLPTYKVADLAGTIINQFQKDQAAKEQARLKRLSEEKKSIGEFFDKINVKPFETIPNFTDQASNLFIDTSDYIGQMGMLANQDPSNRYQYQALAKKAEANYNALSTAFGGEDFRKAAQDKLTAYSSGDYFLDSDTKDKLELASKGMLRMELDRSTGDYKFALPRNINSKPDDPVEWYSAGEVQSWYTNPEQLDWMNPTNANKGNTFPKELNDLVKNFADEYSINKDGNKTVEKKVFAKDRATNWFDSKYGSYKADSIDPRLNQYAKLNFGNEIDSEEDYLKTKNAIIDYIGSQVATEEKTGTKYTAAQLAGQQLDNAETKKRTANIGRSGGSSGASSSPQFFNAANQQAIVQVTDAKGKVIGVRNDQPMRVLTLPKLKGQPATTNVFGVTRYTDKTGKMVNAYYIGTPAKDGRIVTSRINENELNSNFIKVGYNPVQAKAMLMQETDNNKIPVVTQPSRIIKGTDYEKTETFLKTKYTNDDDNIFLLQSQ